MSQSETIKILNALKKSYARNNLIDFTMYTFPRYKPSWHHYLVADRLEMLERREIDRLIINLPRRHGKSELVCVRFPAWYFGRNAYKEIIAISYNDFFASRFGQKARNVASSIETREIFKETKLSEESAAMTRWTMVANKPPRACPYCGANDWRGKFGRPVCRKCGSSGEFAGYDVTGEYHAAGIGGAVTGMGSHFLSIDDPIKNRQEAQSATMRDNVWNFYISTAYTGQEKGGTICVIHTRWHEDDLTGRILQNMKDNNEEWHILRLPAIAEQDEFHEIHNPDYIKRLGTNIIERKKGEPLWPEKYSLAKLEQIKKVIGSYEWSALYQQQPQPASGGIFKRKYFQYYSKNHEFFHLQNIDGGESTCLIEDCKVFAVMDLATSMKETADYTVALVFAVTPEKKILILDVVRERFEAADHEGLVKQVYNLWKPIVIGIESTQYQISLVQKMIRKSFPVKAIKPDKDKVTRSLPMQARMEAGSVYFKMNASWLDCFENELLSFPNGKHDDQVDAFAYTSEMIAPYFINLPEYKINSDRKRFSLNLNGY